MELVGSASWQFTESVDELPHVALYVRDVASLEVPADREVPPPLAGLPPVRPHLLTGEERRAAGRDWAGWWRELLDVELRLHAGPDGPDDGYQAWLMRWGELRERVADPPEFRALEDRPALRKAVVDLYADAMTWVDEGPRAPERLVGSGHFRWDPVSSSAQDVASRHGVSPGAVRGVAMVLDVDGVWWHRVAPGAAVCSVPATETPETAAAILRDVFESGLG
jgi:hypothetical protein